MWNRTLSSNVAIMSGLLPDLCGDWKGCYFARRTGASFFFRLRCCSGQWPWRLTPPWLSALEGVVLPPASSVRAGQVFPPSVSPCLSISDAFGVNPGASTGQRGIEVPFVSWFIGFPDVVAR